MIYECEMTDEARAFHLSSLVQEGLRALVEQRGRDGVSGRGHVETLRAARAARVALEDLEAVLTQEKPVRRQVRRYHPS